MNTHPAQSSSEAPAALDPSSNTSPVLPATPSRVSSRKLAANRANAQKSTGPKTPEGKARSSQNALKHGLLASSLQRLLAAATAEERESYVPLVQQLYAELDPQGVREQLLVERLALVFLRQLRLQRIERNAIAELLGRTGSWESRRPTSLPYTMPELLRHDSQAERAVSRALRELRRLQRDRQQREAARERELDRLVSGR